jgi:UDP-N-acetylglucosamine 2-epimerase (non-hydrolysing)
VKYILVAGARPNFMKVAPILQAFRANTTETVLLVHTGQHYDERMSQEFFRDLRLPEPDVNLSVGSGTHAQQTARVMMAFEGVCLRERPDWVVVVGDVNSTVAAALASKKLGIRVAHVEAGLRSRDMSMPEEINRLCTDAISDLLFTTDRIANENLRAEGVPELRIRLVGNTMIDTLLANLERARSLPPPMEIADREYAVLTLHRPSNVDDPDVLAGLMHAIQEIASRIPIVFPVHPRTASKLNGLRACKSVHLTEPMGYLRFLALVARSRMVLTDSGGIQEETTVLGVPCVTMRCNTERPVTCEIGTNILVGNRPDAVRNAALRVLSGETKPHRIPDLWDGCAGERIVQILTNLQ